MNAVIEAARAAHARRDWASACALFNTARAQGELSPDDLYVLSDAAWWLGDNDQLFEACERAYWLYLEAGKPRRAALAAIDMAAALFLRGDDAIASGWISRAGRHLETEPDSAEHGYLIYLTEVEGPLDGIIPSEATALEEVLAAARRVQEIGRRHGDRTLITIAAVGEGRALTRFGRVADGLALLEEARLPVLSDDLNPVWTGYIYCHLIDAAVELGDLRRARDWTDAMTRWLEGMPAAVVFNGTCRVHRARVQQLNGAWDEAEREARSVCIELGSLHVAAAAKAHYQVGEIRRLRGDFEGAEAAYQQAHSLGRDPQPGLALLRLAQGRGEVAGASIRSALLAERNRFVRAGLRAAQVEIAIATGAIVQAREAADELDQTAAFYGSTGLAVIARHARGAILLREGRPDAALPILREACRIWSDAEAPYDCARVRLLLVEVYRKLGDDDAADRELDVAVSVFERLGAATEATRAAAFRRAERRPGGLTPRQAQLLALVASGRTNKAIAHELGLSQKTVARHLANIFAKLGVKSRTAAAAFAFETGLARRTEPTL